MTHELIANNLGVRREGVTQAARRLREAGSIDSRRGHVTVLDRPKLEGRVCECYDVIKNEYDRLLSIERRGATRAGKACSPSGAVFRASASVV
jgi:Mn-dependent DtxR family transcriptional regulator